MNQVRPIHNPKFPSSHVYPQFSVKPSDYVPPGRARSELTICQAEGLSYEALVGRILVLQAAEIPGAVYRYQFAVKGPGGTLIPDHLVVLPHKAIILETKRTYRPEAERQLRRYAHSISCLFYTPCVLVQVVKNLTGEAQWAPKVSSLADTSEKEAEGPFLWHIFNPKRILEARKWEQLDQLQRETRE